MSNAHASARHVAFDALLRVELDAAFLDRVLPAAFRRSSLSPEDRGLANEMAYGVLRRRLPIDRTLATLMDRPIEEVDVTTLTALRMGAFQILYLDRVPPHAAVHETVEVLKQRRKSAAGFANAILRRLADPARRAPLPKVKDDVERLSLLGSCPRWITQKFIDTAREQNLNDTDLERVLASQVEPAHPTLRVFKRRMSAQALLDRLLALGADAELTPRSETGVRVRRIGDISQLDGFGHDFIAQDEAAQWAAALAEGEQGPTLDACAAPGGKTLALWDMGHFPLTAMEVQPSRFQLLEGTLKTASVDVSTLQGSAEQPPFAPHSFQTVMVDAPCTGSGTLRRHPEMRWRMAVQDTTRLVSLQASILEATAPLVKPGGCLIYAVCSVFSDEGPKQIERFLAAHGRFSQEASMSSFSYMDTMDGFYAVRLRAA